MMRGSALWRQGFSAEEIVRLVALQLWYGRDAFRELTQDEKRLGFAHWLVEHGCLDEGVDPVRSRRISFLAFLAQRRPRRKVDRPVGNGARPSAARSQPR